MGAQQGGGPTDGLAQGPGPLRRPRKWFGHDPNRWAEFRRRYAAELEASGNLDLLKQLAQKAQKAAITLVYAAKDQEHNNAVVLKELLEERFGQK
jgi:uncharacterized protein YeaO (DUF488 family)